MTHLKKIVFVYSFLLFTVACSDKQNTDQVSENNSENTPSFLTHVDEEELFKSNCITCHSQSYIDMQPSFPKKTWEKIVEKMVKNFGAPIPDSSAKKIVNYLAAIKGK